MPNFLAALASRCEVVRDNDGHAAITTATLQELRAVSIAHRVSLSLGGSIKSELLRRDVLF